MWSSRFQIQKQKSVRHALSFSQSSQKFIRSNGEVQDPFADRVVDGRSRNSGEAGADILTDSISAVWRIIQMAFVKNAFNDRLIIHCSQMVIDVIAIQPHAGFRIVDLFFGCAPAKSHDSPAVLLSHGTLRIENLTDIIHTNDVGHFDQAGFWIHLHFNKVGLPGHSKRLIVPLSEHRHHDLISGIGMRDERFPIKESPADLSQGNCFIGIRFIKNHAVPYVDILRLPIYKRRARTRHESRLWRCNSGAQDLLL